MKIVLIHGQSHKGSTYHIGRMLAESFPQSDVTDFFFPEIWIISARGVIPVS